MGEKISFIEYVAAKKLFEICEKFFDEQVIKCFKQKMSQKITYARDGFLTDYEISNIF